MPLLLNTSYTITADIEVPQGGAEGMILTSGGRFAGYGFYLLGAKPVFLWNMLDLERIKWEGVHPKEDRRHVRHRTVSGTGGVGRAVDGGRRGRGPEGTTGGGPGRGRAGVWSR